MVQLDVVRRCNAQLMQSRPLVAVFVGGTNGIGKTTLKALASTHSDKGKGLRVYIVGRRKEATEELISECVRLCPPGDFRFVQASDLSLLEDVDKVCADIIQREEDENKNAGTARVDILCMSQGDFTFEPYKGNPDFAHKKVLFWI